MASLTFLPFASVTSPHLHLNPHRRRRILSLGKSNEIKSKKALSDVKTSESENVLLKVAWYSSELLGIAASVIRSPQNVTIESPAPATTGGNEVPLVLDRETVVKSIKDDFSRSYFVTGQRCWTLEIQLCDVLPLEANSVRHVEHWNVPKMALLKQLLRPTKPFLFWR
ncbi:hypothetical protein QQ045_012455 [Rhodiola kirilowii]